MPDQEFLGNAVIRIQAQVPGVADPAEQPAQFLLGLHKLWKERGGKSAGKPRHSDRYLEDQLRNQRTPVRSLTPKLVGKTRIGPADGRALARYFLSNWPEAGSENGDVRYEPLLPQAEIDAVADFVESQLELPPLMPSIKTPEPIDPQPDDLLPGESNARLIERLFRDCDALVTVSPEHVFVASGPKTELIGFRDLIDLLHRVEETDGKARPLIWVLDLGGSKLDDLATRRYYLNVQQLIIRFKALTHFWDPDSEARLEWLKSRAAIVLFDAHGVWRKRVNIAKLPHFQAHHCSLITTAPEWMSSSNFRALYGYDLEVERMQQRVFQVFYNASAEWDTTTDVEGELRYFGYGSFRKSTGDMVGRGLELPALPLRYSDAFGTVCVAAANALNITLAPSSSIACSGEEAKGQLEYLGYRILNIDEFLANY
jgi:hypothetical protein